MSCLDKGGVKLHRDPADTGRHCCNRSASIYIRRDIIFVLILVELIVSEELYL